MTIQIHIIITALILVASVLTAAGFNVRFRYSWARRGDKRHPRYSILKLERDDFPSWWFRNIAAGIAALLGVVLVISLVPFNPKYWVLTQHEGTIASISNRFVGGTGDVSGATYTLTLAGDRTPRVVTDSRILGLEVGDHVDMTCSLGWVYGGADTYDCYLRSF